MNPFKPGPADAGGLGTVTLNLPGSVALVAGGSPGVCRLSGS